MSLVRDSQLTVDCLCKLLLYFIPLAPVSPPFTYQSIRIPEGCSVRGSKVEEEEERVLRQAVCNESPCPCDGSPEGYGECCSVRGEMETVRIHCHHANGTDLSQKVVTSCKCVPCKEKMVGIAGHVISSATSRPVPLASLMIDGKAIGTSDLSGNFAATFKTTRSFLELTVAEPHHKLGKVGIRPGNQKLTIVLETLQNRVDIEHMNKAFSIPLASTPRLGVEFSVSDHSLVHSDSEELYRGPGAVFHAVYETSNPPSFHTGALNNMVYVDSKGVSFGIESLVLGSLDIISDRGVELGMYPGASASLSVNLSTSKSDFSDTQLQKLHLFTCSSSTGVHGWWRDRGPVKMVATNGTQATVVAMLRHIVRFWAIGLPVRSECFVKVVGVETGTQMRVPGMHVIIQQYNLFQGLQTFARQLQTTSANGTCLRTSCNGGGKIVTQSAEATNISIEYGLTWTDDITEINFYIAENSGNLKGAPSPYYTSRATCEEAPFTHDTAFFFIVKPSLLSQNEMVLAQKEETLSQHCFVKVAIDDCLLETDVQSLSIQEDNGQMSALHVAVATSPSESDHPDDCYSDVVTSLRSACVEYACGHTVKITVRNRPKFAESKECRFVGTSTFFPSTVQPSSSSFQFKDSKEHHSDINYSTGLYSSPSHRMALMSCMSGDKEHPSTNVEHSVGYGPMFTCQF